MLTRSAVQAACLAVVLTLSRVPSINATEPVSDYTAIDNYVQSQVDANHFPGVALAVVDGASLAHAQGFGHDVHGQRVTAQTPFMIGSNSKSFTALAVMQLVDAGAVALDEPVQSYLPQFRVADPAASAQITVRQLLNQTSGIPATAAGDMLLEFRDASLQQGLAALSDVQLHASPGTAYEYANANYMVLGMVVEEVTHERYAMYVQRHILEPLEMSHTRFESGSAVGYRFWFGVPVPDSTAYTSDVASVPTGGVVSTAEDMSHYLAMYLSNGEYAGTRIVSASALAEMQRGVSDVTFSEGDRIIRLAYGMGWATGDVGGTPAVYHIGGSPQFSSWMVLAPSRHLALITLTNANNWIPGPGVSSTELIPKGVMLMLTGETPELGTSLPSMYIWIDVLAAALAAVLTWSLVQRARHPIDRLGGGLHAALAVGPLAWELGLPLAVWLGFPQLYDVHSWAHVMAYTPDLAMVATTASAIWLFTGIVRGAQLVHRPVSTTAGLRMVAPRTVAAHQS
jgi:CubicO group peptidase (beta-lactamase class C family)